MEQYCKKFKNTHQYVCYNVTEGQISIVRCTGYTKHFIATCDSCDKVFSLRSWQRITVNMNNHMKACWTRNGWNYKFHLWEFIDSLYKSMPDYEGADLELKTGFLVLQINILKGSLFRQTNFIAFILIVSRTHRLWASYWRHRMTQWRLD